MRRSLTLIIAIGLAATACTQKKQQDITVVPGNKPKTAKVSPYSSGKTHTEPVFYNGKFYNVSMTHGGGLYDVVVAGAKGRSLGGTSGDSKVVQSLASSAVGHFACKSGKRAKILPGTAQHKSSKWRMKAQCV